MSLPSVGSHLTCVGCCVLFHDSQSHKQHFQTDWHRFNIHRSLESLPPITLETYQQTVVPAVLARQEAEAHKKLVAGSRNSRLVHGCPQCQKAFSTDRALASHQKSKGHADGAALLASKTQRLVLSEDDPELEAKIQEQLDGHPVIDPSKECIFCSYQGAGLEDIMLHMTQAHSLFVPDLEYVADLAGLVTYLAEKVSLEFKCLYCSSCDPEAASQYHSLSAVRKHMVDKSHIKIRFDDEGCQELSPFYNWDSLFAPSTHANDIGEDGDEEEEWEDASDGESGAASRAPRALYVSPDGTELMLPSGACIGNRAYQRYYRQHLPRLLLLEDEASVRDKLVRDYRQRGQLTVLSEEDRRTLERSQRASQNLAKDRQLAVSVKANKLQPHLRIQIR